MSTTAIEEAFIEAEIEDIRKEKHAVFSDFGTGNSEIDAALVGGKMRLTSTAEDRAIIYATETGEPREVLVNMLSKTLAKRLPNGERAFSREPMREYKLGQFMCPLHRDHPGREMLDLIGLEGRECESAHLASEFDVSQHLKSKHSKESKIIAEYQVKADRDEERALMREQTNAVLALARRDKAPAAPKKEMN